MTVNAGGKYSDHRALEDYKLCSVRNGVNNRGFVQSLSVEAIQVKKTGRLPSLKYTLEDIC